MALTLALSMVLLCPQGPQASIVSGVVQDGRFPLTALGLGDGGMRPGTRKAERKARGQHVTRGGVLVRAQPEGVKVDFPTGAELLVSPDGAVHLRDGEHTLRSFRAVEIWLADGSRVRAVPAPARRGPFTAVEVADGKEAVVLWRRHAPVHYSRRAEPPNGTCYLALGDGSVLYQPACVGPLIALSRALCSKRQHDTYPPHRVVIAGDVLADSLRRLPTQVRRRSTRFPQAPQIVANLAQATPALFPRGSRSRPPGAVGELIVPLAGDLRLAVEQHGEFDLRLALYERRAALPVVEWQVGPRTKLYLLWPEGRGEPGNTGENKSRYFTRGLDMGQPQRTLLPVPADAAAYKRAGNALRALGVRSPTLPVAKRNRRKTN